MKRLVLFLLLTVSYLSLSSFGIVSNPRLAEQKSNEVRTMSINSKSMVSMKNQVALPMELKSETNVEKQESENKNFMKSFFDFIISALSQIVLTLLSK